MKVICKAMVFAIVIFTSITLTSCSSDDDTNTGGNENPSIVGIWQTTSVTIEEFTNNVSVNIIENTIDDSNKNITTFNADGTFSATQNEVTIENGEEIIQTTTVEGTYSINGNTIITSSEQAMNSEASFTVSSTQLIVVNTILSTDNEEEKKFVFTTTFNRL